MDNLLALHMAGMGEGGLSFLIRYRRGNRDVYRLEHLIVDPVDIGPEITRLACYLDLDFLDVDLHNLFVV